MKLRVALSKSGELQAINEVNVLSWLFENLKDETARSALPLREKPVLGNCGDHLAIMSTFIEGTPLFNLQDIWPPYGLSPKGERDEIFSRLKQVVTSLDRVGVVHGDINPRNIIVSKNPLMVFLVDFGLATKDGHYLGLLQPRFLPFAHIPPKFASTRLKASNFFLFPSCQDDLDSIRICNLGCGPL